MTKTFFAAISGLVATCGTLACGDPGVPWVEIEGGDFGANLHWPTRFGATYSVYRSSEEWVEFWTGVAPNPRFDISDPGVERVAEGLTEGAYGESIPLFMGDPFAPSGVFYRVVEHTALGDYPSEPVGRIPRLMWHSTPINPDVIDNDLPVCLDPTPDETLQQQLLFHDVASITWWEPQAQGYAYDEPPFTSVVDIDVGTVLRVRPNPQFSPHGKTWYDHQLTGRVPAFEELVRGVYEGHNAVTWPVTAAPTVASALLSGPGHMEHAIAVGQFSAGMGRIGWHPAIPPVALPGVDHVVVGDFSITPCSALYVYIDAGHAEGTALGELEGLTWPPALADAP
jgi:hypothetical protein